jgi:ABC-type Zn uptake system ZnuABC Zn-binding protein ZnuA
VTKTLFIVGLFIFPCGQMLANVSPQAAPRPVVIVAVEPVALLVREICEDSCDVLTLIPKGVSEHDWQPEPKEIVKAKNAVASIAIGLGFDDGWFKKIGTDPKSIFWLGPMLSPMPWWSDDITGTVKHDHETATHKGHEHEHGKMDPHVWVDAVRMASAATAVAQHLSKVLPASSTGFEGRAKIISQRLAALQLVVEARRKTWSSRPVVMFHDVAGYFGRRFDLPVLAVASGSSGHHLSARMMGEMSRRFAAANVAAVVVERDGGAAKNLARELKTTIKVVDFAASKKYTNWDAWYLQVVDAWESILKK